MEGARAEQQRRGKTFLLDKLVGEDRESVMILQEW